jgi:hypothetical protein
MIVYVYFTRALYLYSKVKDNPAPQKLDKMMLEFLKHSDVNSYYDYLKDALEIMASPVLIKKIVVGIPISSDIKKSLTFLRKCRLSSSLSNLCRSGCRQKKR